MYESYERTLTFLYFEFEFIFIQFIELAMHHSYRKLVEISRIWFVDRINIRFLQNNKIVNTFQIWKRNISSLYNIFISTCKIWLTVDHSYFKRWIINIFSWEWCYLDFWDIDLNSFLRWKFRLIWFDKMQLFISDLSLRVYKTNIN